MMKQRRVVISVVVSFAALALSLTAILSRGAALRETVHNNCLEIEELKTKVRPEPFNLQRTVRIINDLGIDATSPVGRRLVKEAREDRRKERAELAPEPC